MSAEPLLVTGGAGFIGSHTCKQLARTAFCRLPSTISAPAMPMR